VLIRYIDSGRQKRRNFDVTLYSSNLRRFVYTCILIAFGITQSTCKKFSAIKRDWIKRSISLAAHAQLYEMYT